MIITVELKLVKQILSFKQTPGMLDHSQGFVKITPH
jgi:hypothetical protein